MSYNQSQPRLEKAFELANTVKKTAGQYRAVPSSRDPRVTYYVNLREKTCTCPDFEFRGGKCKHILGALIQDNAI